MKRTSFRLLLAVLLAAFGVVAFAQTPTPAPANETWARSGDGRTAPVWWQQHHASRMNSLKAALKITPEQESAWNTYAEAMPPRTGQGPLVSRAELDKLTTPERIDLIEQRRAERIGQMNLRIDATKAFYAQLTPEQQRIFDAQMPPPVPAQ